MSRVFDDAFRKVLGQILRSAPRVRRQGESELRTRRRSRSESGTFSGHRAYVEGDDLRNLDWNVYARTDELFLKLLEDEDRIGLTLILDRSASMAAHGRWPGALRLAGILGGLAIVHLDGLHAVFGPGHASTHEGAPALGRWLEQLETLEHNEEDPMVLARHVVEHGSAGRVLWLSDFAQPDRFARALKALRQHGCRCTGWVPELPTDRVPKERGLVRLRDPETGAEEVLQVDATLHAAMVTELGRLRAAQDGVFGAAGCRLERFSVPEGGDLRVGSWTANGRIYQ